MVPLYLNKISSDSSPLPYSYYDLPFVCKPQQKHRLGLNLGEVLRGDRIWESDYKLSMLNETTCAELCSKTVDKAGLKRAEELIKNSYQVEWIVDNLPGATAFVSLDRTSRYYAAGFPLGFVDENNVAYINNHVILLIRYRRSSKNPQEYVIVAFEVYPKSVATGDIKCPGNSDKYDFFAIDPTKDSDVIHFTYSVYWREDETISWESRWNNYLSYTDDTSNIHWLALINSLVIATLLAIFVAIIMIRTLNRDIQTYNNTSAKSTTLEDSLISPEDNADVSGWKLVFADVFRAPIRPTLLASLIGTGIQFFIMAATVVGFSCLGVLNPSYRGGFLSYALFLFAFSGIFAGYVSARITKNLGGESWAKTAVSTALTVPGFLMILIIIMNFFVWSQNSSSAIPFGTLMALMSIWFFISSPLVVIGCYLGSKVKPTPIPVQVSKIPRQIPKQRRYKGLIASALLGGLLPFSVIFVELMFVYKSVWQTKSSFYYMYGFLGLVFAVLITTVIEMSIVVTYFQLNTEDYRWWWKSFMVGTGSAWWIFLYSIYYYFAYLSLSGFVPKLMYFAYSLIGCVVYGMITGSIGFLASYYFVLKIYSAIKAD